MIKLVENYSQIAEYDINNKTSCFIWAHITFARIIAVGSNSLLSFQ